MGHEFGLLQQLSITSDCISVEINVIQNESFINTILTKLTHQVVGQFFELSPSQDPVSFSQSLSS